MKKNMEKVLIGLIIFIIIVIIFVIIYLNINREENDEINNLSNSEEIEPEQVDSLGYYLAVGRHISEYIYMTSQQDMGANIYNLLERNWISDNNITQDNIYNNIETYSEYAIIKQIQTYYQIINENITAYFSYIRTTDEETNEDNDVYMICLVDNNAETFSLIPMTEEEYNNIKDGNTEFEYGEKNIIRNLDNSFYVTPYSPEEICNAVFNNYIYDIFNDTEEAYNSLDEEYKNTNFPEINDFRNFINQNLQSLNSAEVGEIIEDEEENDFTGDILTYRFNDNNGNEYIIYVQTTIEENEGVNKLLQYKIGG